MSFVLLCFKSSALTNVYILGYWWIVKLARKVSCRLPNLMFFEIACSLVENMSMCNFKRMKKLDYIDLEFHQKHMKRGELPRQSMCKICVPV